MKKSLRILIPAILFLFGGFQTSQAQSNMYCVSPYVDSMWVVDTTSWTTTNRMPLTLSGGGAAITGCNGLAFDATTGNYYIIVKIDTVVTGRVLGTLDVGTGVVTTIGNTEENVASITVDGSGNLWAVSGDGGTLAENLYSLNKTTGVLTDIGALGNGSDGECIAFNPDDGMLYHWSGRDTDPTMETANTTNAMVDTIPRTGHNYDEPFCAVYVGGGRFLMANLDQELIYVEANGNATLASATTDQLTGNYLKGMTFGPLLPGVPEIADNGITLMQNRPNPFRDETVFTFTLEESKQLTLVIYDLQGHRVAQLFNGQKAAGEHQVTWNGTNDAGQPLAAGQYFYSLDSQGKTLSKSLLIIR